MSTNQRNSNDPASVEVSSAEFASIEERIKAACSRAGRLRSDVTLVGASKRQPEEQLRRVYAAGLRCFGENRVQEALEKRDLLPDDIDWHLIGPLQSNKAARAAELFSTVHSIDRLKIARALAKNALARGRHLDGFIQVNLGLEESKHGFDANSLRDPLLLRSLLQLEGLKIRGLMAIPPLAENPGEARVWFALLRTLRDELAADYPQIKDLSMGMSGDFEIAIEEGATHIRLGSILFGERDAVTEVPLHTEP